MEGNIAMHEYIGCVDLNLDYYKGSDVFHKRFGGFVFVSARIYAVFLPGRNRSIPNGSYRANFPIVPHQLLF